jgi:uncharacterized membrane protein
MASGLEATVIAVVTVVIFYVLLGSVLTFTWNRSVTKVFGSSPLDLVEALFLLVTMNILFGTFTQGALTAYNGYASRVTSGL